MGCRSCGMASVRDDIAIHAWHCLNCGHVNEAVNGQPAWTGDTKALSMLAGAALVRNTDRMLWW
jgi:ribosomal protein L37AE/L43A